MKPLNHGDILLYKFSDCAEIGVVEFLTEEKERPTVSLMYGAYMGHRDYGYKENIYGYCKSFVICVLPCEMNMIEVFDNYPEYFL